MRVVNTKQQQQQWQQVQQLISHDSPPDDRIVHFVSQVSFVQAQCRQPHRPC
jgi:hypothetical protein